jgi:hypothetical protein
VARGDRGGFSLAPAYDLLVGVEQGTFVLADTDYLGPVSKEALAGYGVALIAPRRDPKSTSVTPWPRWLTKTPRRRIETVR